MKSTDEMGKNCIIRLVKFACGGTKQADLSYTFPNEKVARRSEEIPNIRNAGKSFTKHSRS